MAGYSKYIEKFCYNEKPFQIMYINQLKNTSKLCDNSHWIIRKINKSQQCVNKEFPSNPTDRTGQLVNLKS